MKKYNFIFIFILYFSKIFCQPFIEIDTTSNYWNYYQLIIKAEKYNLENNFEDADFYYDSAFKCVDRPFKVDYINSSENIVCDDKEKAIKYLEKAIECGLKYRDIKENTIFDSIFSKKEKKNFKLLCRKSEKFGNKELKRKINIMVYKDQHRARAFWTDWLSWEKQCKIMDKYDRKNASNMLKICKQQGWPGFTDIGENQIKKETISDVSLLIQHFSKEEIDSLLPYMIEAVENGEMYPYHLARCINYLYMGEIIDSADCQIWKRKQIYGIMYSNDTIIPFGKVDEVNKNRYNAGLESIEQFALKTKKNLPVREEDIFIVKK